MDTGFTHAVLGKTGLDVHRLGLSATYWPGKKAVYSAIDSGLNFFFCFGIDKQMLTVMRDVLNRDREKYVVATGAYNLLAGHPNLRRTLEKRLRQLGTDYIDIFLFLGVTKPKHFPQKTLDELCRLKEEGKVGFAGISSHDRRFAGKLAAEGALDTLMIRYNAAHRGAEQDIFPFLASHDPGIVSYTATRWRYLTRRPKKGWPEERPVPDAGLCYRFVLSNPHVHVCLTAPSNRKQLEENISALEKGPLSEEEMRFMREFGDVVYNQNKYFM
jgi:aryl-alcohol dehydrogenase-like predicted oxidoreductase